jgi:putative CocE/NonD family hydrolase
VTWAGGNIDSGFIPLWLGLVTSLGLIPAEDAGTQPAIALNAESQHAYGFTQFQVPAVADANLGAYESQLPPQLQTFKDQAYDGDFATLRSPIYRIANVHVPTFIIGGEWDIFQRGEPLLYRALSLPSTQKKLVLGPWYHTTAGNGLPATDNQGRTIPNTDTLQLAWFDHWLKGVNNGIDTFPDETWFQGSNQWIAGSYPQGHRPQAWYLGAGTLGSARPAAAGSAVLPWTAFNGICSRSTTQWTAGLVNTGSCDTDQRLTEAQGLTFTSPAATGPYTISGPLALHVNLRSTRPDATLIATFSDVAPDGSSNGITAGSLVLSLRQLTTTPCGAVVVNCTVYAAGRPTIPWHPFTKASQTPLQTGTVYGVDLEIFPTSVVIEPGHRIRLTLTSSDVPHESGTLSTTADSAGGPVTILYGGIYDSYLYLEHS